MKKSRNIIEIDESKCNGCGQCITACAEGALALVDGKAKLVGEVYCDGLGACMGECPEGALKVTQREAEDFSEAEVHKLLEGRKQAEAAPAAPIQIHAKEEKLACGCPSSAAMQLKPVAAVETGGDVSSQLTHWPIKLQLLNPEAPYLKGSDMLLLADCTAVSYPNLHKKILKGHTVAMGCPKLDDLDAHIEKLTNVLAVAKPKTLSVVYMEVPCCRGFVLAAEKALEKSGVDTELHTIKISRTGEIIEIAHEEKKVQSC